MKNLILNVDGQRVTVWSQTLGDELWVHFSGKTFVHDMSQKNKRKSRSKMDGGDKNIVAPMPGKILAIKTNVGDSISKGDLVLVMEAMKMEYSLKATQDGVIKSIDCEVGDQVGVKQLLVEIEVSEASDA